MTLNQSFDTQMVIKSRPFDAVSSSNGMTIFSVFVSGVKQSRIISEWNRQRATVHQFDGESLR